jgi:hypothetical protein
VAIETNRREPNDTTLDVQPCTVPHLLLAIRCRPSCWIEARMRHHVWSLLGSSGDSQFHLRDHDPDYCDKKLNAR